MHTLVTYTKPGAWLTATKPRNWRTYYGYRPLSPIDGAVPHSSTVEERNEFYRDWLAKRRGVSKKAAGEIIAAQPSATLIAATPAGEATARTEEAFGHGVVLRTVRNFSGPCQRHYGWGMGRYPSEATLDWHRLETRSSAPITYRIVVDGALVDSFLSKPRAKTKARAIAAAREAAAGHVAPLSQAA